MSLGRRFRVFSPQCMMSPSLTPKRKATFQAISTTPKNHKHFSSNPNQFLSPNELGYLKLNDTATKLLRKNQSVADESKVSPITVHVIPSSPVKQTKHSRESFSYQLPKHLNIPGISAIPLSPSTFDCRSPITHSPSCQHLSPQELLYTPDRNEPRLGKGSFGNVLLCNFGNRPFALKILHRSTLDIGEKNLLGVRHAHLVSVLRVTEVLDKVFVCMEFAGHCNLQQLLDEQIDLNFISRLGFAQQIAAGLNHCHKLNIAHGDVKPVNVIVSPKGECKLGDFGLSVHVNMKSKNNIRKSTGIAGTAPYAAPEILKGMPMYTEADIYSFGITLWQIYTRETPFAGEHPHQIIYKVVSRNMRPVFEKAKDAVTDQYMNTATQCWASNPDQRLTSSEVLQILKKLIKVAKLNTKSSAN